MAEHEVDDEKIESDMNKWLNAQSFSDLQQMMKQFYRGQLSASMCFFGPLNLESQADVDKFCRLVDLGFLPVDSQPPSDTELEIMKPYINGYIHREAAEPFLAAMARHNFLVGVHDGLEGSVTYRNVELDIPGTYLMNGAARYWVTMDRKVVSEPWTIRSGFKWNQYFHAENDRINDQLKDYMLDHTYHLTIHAKTPDVPNFLDLVIGGLGRA